MTRPVAALFAPCAVFPIRVGQAHYAKQERLFEPLSGEVKSPFLGFWPRSILGQDKEPHRAAARLTHNAPQCGAFLRKESAPFSTEKLDFRTTEE